MKSAPRARVEIYQDRKKEWRWRFVVNGRIMADSGEGYAREVGAHRAWEHFCRHITRRTYQTPLDGLEALLQTVTRLAGHVQAEDAAAGLYDRLNLIGYGMPETARAQLPPVAELLRKQHAIIEDSDVKYEDDLLEMADRLDTLAKPILVKRTGK